MRSVPTACPECNSPQRFSARTKINTVLDSIQTYIACNVCGYKVVLHDETRKEFHQRRHERVKLLRAQRKALRAQRVR